MIEELKIISQMMNGVTDGAVKIAILYLVLKFLQAPIVTTIVGYFAYKITSIFFDKKVEVVDVSKIHTD